MHELSIAQSLVQSVVEALADSGPCRVIQVRLRIGVLAGVVPDALQFCYDVATRDTLLEGSTLAIETVPLVVHCPQCDRDVTLPELTRLRCPVCDTPTGAVVQGKELEIESVEVEDAADGS